jgi:hypothetical protein
MDCGNKDNNLHERILMLENTVRNLKLKNENDLSGKKAKKPREQTDYNRFVSSYINSEKIRLGGEFNNKVAFSGAAKKWKEEKIKKEEEKKLIN